MQWNISYRAPSCPGSKPHPCMLQLPCVCRLPHQLLSSCLGSQCVYNSITVLTEEFGTRCWYHVSSGKYCGWYIQLKLALHLKNIEITKQMMKCRRRGRILRGFLVHERMTCTDHTWVVFVSWTVGKKWCIHSALRNLKKDIPPQQLPSWIQFSRERMISRSHSWKH